MSLLRAQLWIVKILGWELDLIWLNLWPELKSMLGLIDAIFVIWADVKLWSFVKLAYLGLQMYMIHGVDEDQIFQYVAAFFAFLPYVFAPRSKKTRLLRRFAVSQAAVEMIYALKAIWFSVAMQGSGRSHVLILGEEYYATMLLIVLIYHYSFEKKRLSAFETRAWSSLIFILGMTFAVDRIPQAGNVLSRLTVGTIELQSSIWADSLRRLQVYEGASYVSETQDLLTPPAFVYDGPLPEDEIRIVMLERRKLGQPPRARLLQGKLGRGRNGTLPSYTAISFVPSDPVSHRLLRVTGPSGQAAHMKVTDSVYDILSREQSFFSSKALWIDSICIDNSRDAEKVARAVNTRHIYEQAKRVDVYLDTSLNTSAVGAWLERVVHLKWFREEEAGQPNRIFEQHFWHDIYKVLDSPWFTFTWAPAHVASAREVFITYGASSFRLDWLLIVASHMSKEISLLRELQLRRDQAGNRGRNHRRFKEGVALALTRGLWHRGIRVDFQTLVLNTLRTDTAEPRDKVFASLALANSSSDYDIPMSYSLPEKEFWTRVMRGALRDGRPDAIPRAAGLSPQANPDGFPSWVSNFDASRSSQIDFLSGLYNASGGAEWRVSNNTNIYQLDVSVLTVGSLHRIAPASESTTSPDSPAGDSTSHRTTPQDRVSSAKAIARAETRHAFPDGSAWQEAFFRTAVQDRMGSESRRITSKDIEDFAGLMDAVCPVGPAKPGWLDLLPSHTRARASQVGSELLATFRDKVFAVTDSDHMAVVPETARPGDVAVLVAGATKPWLLRPAGPGDDGESRTYHFIGDCYVHGNMDGERIPNAADAWTTFTLV